MPQKAFSKSRRAKSGSAKTRSKSGSGNGQAKSGSGNGQAKFGSGNGQTKSGAAGARSKARSDGGRVDKSRSAAERADDHRSANPRSGRPGSRPGSGRPGPRAGRSNGGSSRRRGSDINPQRFVNKAVAMVEQEEFVPEHSFADFPFSERLQRNISARRYTTPTQIQDVSIKPILNGRDMIGLANTGTGKTAAFVLPMIQLLTESQGRALIITPTRELAGQIDDEFRVFAYGLDLDSAVCVGGTSINRQISALKRRPRVVIGTPGRLKDLFNQGKLRTEDTGILVLDEADRMLDMGFVRDIRFLASKLPKQRQSLCFSATITPDVESLMHDFLSNPVTASVRTSETNEHIEQRIIEADGKEDKLKILTGLLSQPEFEKVIIFGETKHGVQKLADKLSKHGHSAQAIHGNKSQAQRQRSLDAFKNNQTNILVATDVASRGLDIPEVSHVINFDQPGSYEDYLHRIGRTGRAGNGGHALTFVAPR